MNARQAAYESLTAVTRDGAYTTLALKKYLPSELSEEDKRFAARLVRTTLENLIRIDFALSGFIRSGRVHGSVRNVLRLGACQMLFMDIEPYAAVSESVAMMKHVKPQMTGFVNAVLRALAKEKDNIRYPQGQNAQALGVAYSYPKWICEKYMADFGYDFAQGLLSFNAPHTVILRMNPLKTNAADLEAEMEKMGLSFSKARISDAYEVSGLSDIENTDIYQKGWIAVQSESAMRAVLAAEIQPGSKLLDCCAAPGGKSAYAAALTGGSIEIVAWDIHEHRIDMMRKNYARLGVNARAGEHDARVYEPSLSGYFDTVLVDAPCSAMGLMSHNPDIRFARKPEDITALSLLQKEILTACSGYTKKGGKLVYSTCSINKEENEEVTEDFLQKHDTFSYLKEPVTLYPHIDGSDGFYVAVMKRNE